MFDDNKEQVQLYCRIHCKMYEYCKMYWPSINFSSVPGEKYLRYRKEENNITYLCGEVGMGIGRVFS